MLILSILHHIFLSDEEIEKLINGEKLEVTGVSLPVWFQNGNTSEPAEEVFCKYRLLCSNDPEPIKHYMKKGSKGYAIEIRQNKDKPKFPSHWKSMSEEDQNVWFAENIPNDITNARSVANGGSDYLHFQEFNKVKQKNKFYTIYHNVEIKTMQSLLRTIS